MKRVHGYQLRASRVYFTEFDRTTYSQVAWTADDVEGIRQSLERKLKLLALVKGNIVIAASHLLESELAREVIGPYPALLQRGIVVPALRSEFSNCQAFLEHKLAGPPAEADLYAGDEQREMAGLIDDSAVAVSWNVEETSQWFKQRLLSELRDSKGFLRAAARRQGLRIPVDLSDAIEGLPVLSRGAVYKLTSHFPSVDLRQAICNYTDFAYYLAGALAVDAEGVLPQENILDFGMSELAGRATPLSEQEVFFKIFIDTVKAATATHFPADFLDALSMNDAIDLHEIAVSEHFVDKYNAIQMMTKQGLHLHDPEGLVLLLDELEHFEHELHTAFVQAVEREVPAYLRGRLVGREGAFLHAVASLVFARYGTVVGTKDIVMSGLRLAGLQAMAERLDDRIQAGLDACRRVLLRGTPGKNAILLEHVDRMKKRYRARLE